MQLLLLIRKRINLKVIWGYFEQAFLVISLPLLQTDENCIKNTINQSLLGEACDRMRMRQLTPKSVYTYENLYSQISITNIAFYAQKLSLQ